MPLKGILRKRGYLRSLWEGRKGANVVIDSYTTNYRVMESAGSVYDFCPVSGLQRICFLPVEADFSLSAIFFIKLCY